LVENIVMTHITAAGLAVGVINWLKKSPYFPWITQEKTKVLRAFAFLTSALAAGGITYAWNPAARQLVLTIPTLSALLGFTVAWAKSFIVQEITYQATSNNGVASILKEILAAVKPPATAQPPATK